MYLNNTVLKYFWGKVKGYIDTKDSANVNQNAYSKITVGDTEIAANAVTDGVTFTAGTNVTLTPDAASKTITVTAVDTTYGVSTTEADGLMSKEDKTKFDAFDTADKYALAASLNDYALASSLDDYAKKEDLTTVYKFMGSVSSAETLPTEGVEVGHVYNIEAASVYGPAGANVAYVEDSEGTGSWDPLGGIFVIEDITTDWIDTELSWE